MFTLATLGAGLIGLLPAILAFASRYLGLRQAQVASGDNTVTQTASVQVARAQNPVAGLLDTIVIDYLGFAIASYYVKIFLFDKVIGSMVDLGAIGATPPLTPELHSVAVAVLGYYTFRKIL